jgi:hypothetical protein
MSKPRVLYLVHEFPQISQTYIRSELEAVRKDCEVRVIGFTEADLPYGDPGPFQRTDDPAEIRAAIEEFRPDVLHGHWLFQVPSLAYFGGYFADGGVAGRQIPFTVRAHSFDTLGVRPDFLNRIAPIINSELCLGVFTFPFTRPMLERGGIDAGKIHDCFPVVDYERFHDRSPNGTAVMNVGACLPKKHMDDFLRLAARFPEREFNLYALGYKVDDIARLNSAAGNPVRIVPAVEPGDMLREYKKHEWLVYTAAYDPGTVGWPMAIAEAQAAGVGVCMPNLRPDLRDYVGPAGFLYNSIEEVMPIVSKPFPAELRELGFEHARKSDINRHKAGLIELWRRAAGATPSEAPADRPRSAGFDWGEVGINWEFTERMHAALRAVCEKVPERSTYLLIDEGTFAGHMPPGRRARPFPEHDGQYWGPPADDHQAVEELHRQRRAGAEYAVFAWPTFWWLEHYRKLGDYLRTRQTAKYEDENVAVFDLRKSS